MPENACVFQQSRRPVVPSSRRLIVSSSRGPMFSQSRVLLGALPSLSQSFSGVPSLSQPIARHLRHPQPSPVIPRIDLRSPQISLGYTSYLGYFVLLVEKNWQKVESISIKFRTFEFETTLRT